MLLLVFGGIRGKRWPGVIALVVLWIFSTPLTAQALWRWLEHPYQRRRVASVLQNSKPTAVVVLGAGRHAAPGPAQMSEWNDADRFFGGLDAFSHLRMQSSSVKLIFTGGWWPTQPGLPSEGEVMRQRAIALGYPAHAVWSTIKVRNTSEEAKEVSKILDTGSMVILVTSAFHMSRALRLFERQGLDVLPFPVDFQSRGAWAGNPLRDPLNYFPTANGLRQSSRAVREVIGRTIYRSW